MTKGVMFDTKLDHVQGSRDGAVVRALASHQLRYIKDWVCHCLLLSYQKVRDGLSSKVIM